jgi:hypothetical protein
MRTLSLLMVAAAAFVAPPTLAQNPPQGTPTRIRGTVRRIRRAQSAVKTRRADRGGALADNFSVPP